MGLNTVASSHADSTFAASPCAAACALITGLANADQCCRSAPSFLHDLPHIMKSADGGSWVCTRLLCALADPGLVEDVVGESLLAVFLRTRA
jgi:hypothetical protein